MVLGVGVVLAVVFFTPAGSLSSLLFIIPGAIAITLLSMF